MFIFKSVKGDSTKLCTRNDGALTCLQTKSSFQWEITLFKATTETRGFRHHSSISLVDPIPTRDGSGIWNIREEDMGGDEGSIHTRHSEGTRGEGRTVGNREESDETNSCSK